MMPEVGHFALILSMVLALVQAGVPLTAVPIRPGTVGVWLAKEQAGDKAAALDDWVALPNDLPGDEEWAPDLKQRIGELTFDSNFDAARKIRPPDEAAESDALGGARKKKVRSVRVRHRQSGSTQGSPSMQPLGRPIAFPRSAAWSMASRLVSRNPRGIPKAGLRSSDVGHFSMRRMQPGRQLIELS